MRLVIVDQKELVSHWVCERINSEPRSEAAIGLVGDHELIAGVMYTDFNGRSIGMHVAAEGHNWLSRDFLWAAFFYPFVQLGVKKIWCPIDSTNAKALKFNQRLGFCVEHVMKDAGGKGDLVVSSMTMEQCKWLDISCELKRRFLELHNG